MSDAMRSASPTRRRVLGQDQLMGGRLVSYYFEVFEARAKVLLAAAGKADDEEKAVACVVDSREMRGTLENFAVVARNHADASVSALLGWRTRFGDTSHHTPAASAATAPHNTSRAIRDELAADALHLRAGLHILLHNDTWQHHWFPRGDLGLHRLTDDTCEALLGWMISRARYWFLEATPLGEGRRRVADLTAEVIGQLSRVRFPYVWGELSDSLHQQLAKGGETLHGKAEREVSQSMRLLRFIRLPHAEVAQRISFFKLFDACSQRTHKNRGLKRALCEVLTNAVAHMAARVHIAASPEEETSLLESLWATVERWSRKPKHIPAAFPLLTGLMCAAPLRSQLHEKFDNHFETVLRKLSEDRERKLRCLHLESLIHLLGHYLTFMVAAAPQPSRASAPPSRYIPPPPDEPGCGTASSSTAAKRDPLREGGENLPKVAAVSAAISSLGRRQAVSTGQGNLRAYALCVDIVVLLCRAKTRMGVSLILSLLPSDSKEAYTENALVGLYSLLCLSNLSQHYQPQGSVEEHGVSQGVMLHWWALGLPNGRAAETQAVRLRSPFTSFRPPSPTTAILWTSDRCLTPSLSGLWSTGTSLLLDTSTLCTNGVATPGFLQACLGEEGDVLSARISTLLGRCERDLTAAAAGGSTRWDRKLGGVLEGNSERDRGNAHVFRIALLVSAFVSPSGYTVEQYFGLLMRVACHPNVELRETVCTTVLPQIALQRASLIPQLLASAAEAMLSKIDDTEAVLLLLQMLLRLLSLLCCVLDYSKRASVPLQAAQMIGRTFRPIGDFSRDTGREDRAGREGDPLVLLESACLVFLSTPYTEVRGKSLAALHWLTRLADLENSPVAAPPGSVRITAEMERELPRIERVSAAIAAEFSARTSPRDHRWPGGGCAAATPATAPATASGGGGGGAGAAGGGFFTLPGGGGAGCSSTQTPFPEELPECLKADAIPLTPAAKIVLYSPVWAYCAGFLAEHLARAGSGVPVVACSAIAQRFAAVVSRASDAKGDAAEDRRAEEACVGYTMLMAAGCERQPAVLGMLVSLLKSPSAELRSAAAVAMMVVPRAAVGTALDQLRLLDDDAKAVSKKEKTRSQAWVLRGLIVHAHGRLLQRTQQADWAETPRMLDVANWLSELVDALLCSSMDRLLCFDQATGLRCRVDVLEVISIVTSLLHQHSQGRCVHHITRARRGKWLAFCIQLSHHDAPPPSAASSVRTSRSAREESVAAGAECIEPLQALVRAWARVAASSLLAGPLLAQPDMVWIDDCAAGRVSHDMGPDTSADLSLPLSASQAAAAPPGASGAPAGLLVTYPLIISFIHSLLPASGEAVTFSVWGDDTRAAEMCPAVAAGPTTGTPQQFRTAAADLSVSGATLAFKCMNALLKCNVACPGLVRGSAALALHKNGAVAKLHLCTLANAVCSGTLLPRPTLPMVLAAVVCGIADLDEELRMASWRLIPFICPQLDIRHYPRTRDGATRVVAAAAELLPEAGAVLVSLAKDRLPMFSTARRIRLLGALSHWASHLKPETPSDVDELLSLTESYYTEHPVVLQELWGRIGIVDSIITRLQERCVASLLVEAGGADDVGLVEVLPADPMQIRPTGLPWELCNIAFSMVTRTEAILAQVSELLLPHPLYAHRAATALVFAAQVFNDTSGSQMVPLLPGLLHAASVVGCNHPKVVVCRKSRILLRCLLAFEGTRPTAARDRLLELLFVSEGAHLSVDAAFVQALVAVRPLSTDVLRGWIRTALACLRSAEMPQAVRSQSIRIYSNLTEGAPEEDDFEALASGLVVCMQQRETALAASFVGALTPVAVRLVWGVHRIPSVWAVLSLIRCRECPALVEAAAGLCNLCLPVLPPPTLPVASTLDTVSGSSVHMLVRAALSQLFLVPPCTHDALLQLLQIVLKNVQAWELPLPVLYHYHCVLVACLLPELCMRFPQHSMQGGLISTLAGLSHGQLAIALRTKGSASDFLHKATEAVGEGLWGGPRLRDKEVGRYYHHMIESSDKLAEGALPWVLRCVAHLLVTPAVTKVGASSTAFASVLQILPNLAAGPAQNYAAHCLSLAALRDKPSSRGSQSRSPRSGERRNKFLAAGCTLDEGAASISSAVSSGVRPARSEDGRTLLSFAPAPPPADSPTLRADPLPQEPGPAVLSRVGGAFNHYPLEGDATPPRPPAAAFPPPPNDANDNDVSDEESDPDTPVPLWAQPDVLPIDTAAVAALHPMILSAAVLRLRGTTLALVGCRSATPPLDTKRSIRQALHAAVGSPALPGLPALHHIHVCDERWSFANGILQSHLPRCIPSPRPAALLNRYSGLVEACLS